MAMYHVGSRRGTDCGGDRYVRRFQAVLTTGGYLDRGRSALYAV